MSIFRLETDNKEGIEIREKSYDNINRIYFCRNYCTDAVNIAGYNSKGIAMLIFLTVLGISLITTAGSINKKSK